MKVIVDRGRCSGYANCVDNEPRVFDLDEDGLVTLLADDDIPEAVHEAVREAVRDCPMRALTIEE